MAEIQQIIEGKVVAEVKAVLDDGSVHKTGVAYNNRTAYTTASKAVRDAKTNEVLAAEFADQILDHQSQVAQSDELMAVIEAEIDWADPIPSAQQHSYWQTLVGRGSFAIEAALKRALSASASDAVRELWMAFAGQVAAADIPLDGTLAARLLAWQEWAQANSIEL